MDDLRRGVKKKGKKGMTTQPMATPVPIPRTATREEVVSSSLQSAVTGGDFTNKVFYAYTRRTASGVVDRPHLIFANEAILRSVSDYFVTLFQWDIQDGHMSTDDYDYMSDSDLDDDNDEVDADGRGTPHEYLDSQRVPESSQTATDGPSRLARGPREEAENSKTSTGIATPVLTEDSSTPPHTLPESTPSSLVTAVGPVRKPIPLETVAFKTFQSFVIWCLIGKIAFLPLRSQPPSVHMQYSMKSAGPYGPPPCSPKSMYRLAHTFGIAELKKLALDDIMTKITPDNILSELGSSLTIRYTELQEAEVNMLIQKGLTPAVLSTMPRWLAEISSSLGPPGLDIVALLIQKMAQNTSAFRNSSNGGWY
ncbi:uncharacterized protein C8Q71DRAFT_269925 [Rhodofomes roseus]|uniref:BTB domain-containing protein n=1 Tax=Rhodofomes roseus TaxID=34475 RepID=A0ABQ8K5N8_9APHY|nr:uncharacterized protein C8Q71DRAFT_269925 [Rhodofomes roseus]KAH9832286.1 hypothetical protein C8Q71DRAFT_269925 [Rhodofomes roseus]